MLSASDLKNFQEAAKQAISEITRNITVVSDNDVANFTRDIKSRDNELVLVGVLPSMQLNYRDEDDHIDNNKMLLFLVRKFDLRESNEDFLAVYDETGAAVKKMVDWLIKENQRFNCSSIFRQIDFRTFSADPVRDYHNLFGYMISFDLRK